MNDFTPVLIKDARLADITDNLDYAVMSGASSNTYQPFNYITANSSSMTFNVQVPSENIVVNREVLINTTINVQLRVTNVPIGKSAWCYGSRESMAPFPLNQLFTTSSCQINNTSVSVNTQDVLAPLLAIGDMETAARYNGMTPSLPDAYYKFYNVACGDAGATLGFWQPTNNNPMGGFNYASYDNDLLPRGAYPPASATYERWKSGATGTTADLISTALTDVFFIRFSIEVTEPIIGLSPFIYGCPQFNKQGLVGVNAMSFVFNIDSTARRMYSRAYWQGAAPFVAGVDDFKLSLGFSPVNDPDGNPVFTDTKEPFPGARLLVNFLSTQPSDLISAKNVVPFMDLPRYISSPGTDIPWPAPAKSDLISNNIQLNQLPDYFIIYCRDRVSQNFAPGSVGLYSKANSFLSIKSISVNLSNTSGLLSSATQQDLWRMSVNNGSNQSWLAFSGNTNVGAATTIGYADEPYTRTVGSVLILSPAMDLSLPDYITSGSIGQFNFQFNLGVQSFEEATATPEIVVICVNSGIFSTVAGSSSVYTGILSKQIVLDTKSSQRIDPVTSTQYIRSVGGSLADRALGALKANPLVKRYTDKIKDRMCGGGPSGGAYSGGGPMSGGRLSHLTIR